MKAVAVFPNQTDAARLVDVAADTRRGCEPLITHRIEGLDWFRDVIK